MGTESFQNWKKSQSNVTADLYMWDMEAVRAILLSDNAPAQYTCQIWFTSDPDQLGSTGQKRAEWFLHTSLLTDQVHLDKTWHSQPELNWIQADFA